MRRLLGAGAAAAAGVLAYGAFESQWLRDVERTLWIPGLPRDLDGLRVGHLSDLHAGAGLLNSRAVRRGVALLAARRPDLVCVTGDLRARHRDTNGLAAEVLGSLEPPLGIWAVLGNHDYAGGREPFEDGIALDAMPPGVRLLRDETAVIEAPGAAIAISGADPRSWYFEDGGWVRALRRPAAGLHLLLSHYPRAIDAVAPGAVDLILSGHLHGGQICVPTPTGKLRLAHHEDQGLGDGIYERAGTSLHISRGLGTTFVPFRFAARPESTLLVLRRI